MGLLKRRIIEAMEPTEYELARRWIPVSERLPEDFREVLVTNGRTHLLATCSQWAKYDTPLWMAAGGRCYPTHWMPLPEPPEVK